MSPSLHTPVGICFLRNLGCKCLYLYVYLIVCVHFRASILNPHTHAQHYQLRKAARDTRSLKTKTTTLQSLVQPSREIQAVCYIDRLLVEGFFKCILSWFQSIIFNFHSILAKMQILCFVEFLFQLHITLAFSIQSGR